MNDSIPNNQEDSFIEEIEHTADWAIRVKGSTIEALFKNAALGMLHLLQISSKPGEKKTKTIEINAFDTETLLVAWLEEILFELEANEVTFRDIDVESVNNGCLRATLREEPLGKMLKEIKAVTFSNLRIETTNEGFATTVVFDV